MKLYTNLVMVSKYISHLGKQTKELERHINHVVISNIEVDIYMRVVSE